MSRVWECTTQTRGIYLRQHSVSLRVAQEEAVVYDSILKLTEWIGYKEEQGSLSG